jgi:sodium-dependent phosphate cotransporter
VGPLTKEFIKIDKDLIKTLAKGCLSCNTTHAEPAFCKAEKKLDDGTKLKFCLTGDEWTQKYQEDGRVIKSGFSKDLGDEGGAVLILVISLVFLCIALYYIVKLLHYLVLSSGRAEADGDGQNKFVQITQKILRFNGFVSILFGMVMTIAVQSSSIVTSTLTPIVALGIISVEDMLPLTLGANIGTTCTAFLAAIVTEKKSAIMISVCHLFFNIFGIAIFYPAPFMRRIPIKIAYRVGDHVLKYKWFGPFYICLVFVVVPLLLFLCSLALDLGVGGIILNVIFDSAIVIGTFLLVAKLDRVVEFCTARFGKGAQEAPQEMANTA